MLANKKEASEMAVRGRQLVDSHYTFEHVAQRLNKIYKEAYASAPTSLSGLSVSRKKAARTPRSRSKRL
ncbi:hypothetical protein D3C83_237110 [compost metagenome]